jgi:ketosteroid isomerase-like protein
MNAHGLRTGEQPNAIAAVVGWIDAMRRADLQAVAGWFDPQVTWRGVPDDAINRNRDDVLEMLRDSLTPCPEDPQTFEADGGLRGAVAIELIAASDDTVVLGAKVPGLTEVGGHDLRGQLFNVFRTRGGRIVEVADYALRDQALEAAGANAPEWH